MSIGNYSELQTAIGANWLNRTDLTARVPEFIALCEADIRADLRYTVVREPLTLASNAVALPAACVELRSVRYNSTTLQAPLTMTTHSGLASLRRLGAGNPGYFAVLNNVLLLDVDPDPDSTAEIVYFSALVSLSDEAPTNATLTAFPNIYLYGSLLHAAPYLEHDERIPVWQNFYDTAVAKANKMREESELGAAPMAISLPVVF